MHFKDKRTIAQQIAEHIAIKIMRGVYQAGERLPSIRDLAKEVGVNPNTVSQAFLLLQDQSIIRAERGVGYFVEDNASDELKIQERERFFSEQVPSLKQELGRLGISAQELLSALEGLE